MTDFIEIKATVSIDWGYALCAVKSIAVPCCFREKAIINVLAEYGAIAYKCCATPDSCKLAIIISPPIVRFCPSKDGLSGIFIEEYQEEKHGKCFQDLQKTELSDFDNIHARLDGWQFFADIVSLAHEYR